MEKKSASVVAPKTAVRKLKKVVKSSITNAKQETPASTSAGKTSGKVKDKPLKIEGLADGSTGRAKADKAEIRTGINIGKTSGMRVMAYQDMTLARNDDPKFRLTDTELAALWRQEFPQSRAVLNGRIDENIVRGVRNLYNQGMQGHGTTGVVHESRPYAIQDGKRVSVDYTRARKPKDDADVSVAKAETPVEKKGVTKVKKAPVAAGPLPTPNRAKIVGRKKTAA